MNIQGCSFLAILMLFFSCEQASDISNVKSPLYDCCNFYETEQCDKEDRIKQINCFFRQNDIAASELEIIREERQVICTHCCQCPNGEYLYFKVKNEDLATLEDLEIIIE